MALNVIKDQPGIDSNIFGTPQDDKILGLDGDDILYGKKGDDVLNGGIGNDWLYGGAGKDTFVYNSGGGEDEILDFKLGADKLNLKGTSFGYGDLRDISVNGNNHDHDHDGNFIRQTSENGRPEVQFYFHNTNGGFDSLTILDVTIVQLAHDALNHPDHYLLHS